MSLIITNSKLSHHTKHPISARYLKVKINSHILELPQICAGRADYEKSDTANIPLNAQIFQYHVNISRYKNNDITDLGTQNKILENFKRLQQKYNPKISDVNFRINRDWNSKERDIALQLQDKMNTDFISDVIPDKHHQNKRDYEVWLKKLLSHNSKKTKCPSISMKSNEADLKDQLDVIANKKFDRFNIDWTGTSTLSPWFILSRFLSKNTIWCNMTAIRNKMHSGSSKSYLMLGIAYGANTVGLGFYGGGTFEQPPKPKLFDLNTFEYKTVKNGMMEKCDTISHNTIHNKILKLHHDIQNNTFYKHIPKTFIT